MRIRVRATKQTNKQLRNQNPTCHLVLGPVLAYEEEQQQQQRLRRRQIINPFISEGGVATEGIAGVGTERVWFEFGPHLERKCSLCLSVCMFVCLSLSSLLNHFPWLSASLSLNPSISFLLPSPKMQVGSVSRNGY